MKDSVLLILMVVMTLALLIGSFFHLKVQWLMFTKVRPLLKKHNFSGGVFPIHRKRDLQIYYEISVKENTETNIKSKIDAFEQRSWIFLICSFICLILILTFSN